MKVHSTKWESRNLIFVFALVVALWLLHGGSAGYGLLSESHRLVDPQQKRGLAVSSLLPAQMANNARFLGYRLCESSQGLDARLETWPEWLRKSALVYFFGNRIKRLYPDWPGETWRCLPEESNRKETEIVEKYGGGFSVIGNGMVIFSSPDSTSPLSNNRQYQIVVPLEPRLFIVSYTNWLLLAAVTTWSALFFRRALWPRLALRIHESPTFGGVLLTIVSIVVSAMLLLLTAEGYLRIFVSPFREVEWPSRFESDVGHIFVPNSVVRWTNHLDFWTEERTNSLGFIDREPLVPKPDGVTRILVIGDSFVEAAQIPTQDKFYVLMEQILRDRFSTSRIDTVGLGYSGTGQTSQLPFYRKYRELLNPDLVILLVVSNDISNNSTLLESVRYGTDPFHQPRPFFYRAPGSAYFEKLPIDPDWTKFQHQVEDAQDPLQKEVANLQYLKKRYPDLAGSFLDWSPATTYTDDMFDARDLPPVFEEALHTTREAFKVFSENFAADRVPFLVVLAENVTTTPDAINFEPTMEPGLRAKRLTSILVDLGISFLDLSPGFAARGVREDAIFNFDSHWNRTGHRWAAELISDYLWQHDELVSKMRNLEE